MLQKGKRNLCISTDYDCRDGGTLMSLEPGGRADKGGNHYEGLHFTKLLLDLIQEQISSIKVEPLGIEGESNGIPVTLRGIVYLRQRRRISCAAKTMFTVSFRQFPTMNWTLSVIGREPAEVLRIFPVK